MRTWRVGLHFINVHQSLLHWIMHRNAGGLPALDNAFNSIWCIYSWLLIINVVCTVSEEQIIATTVRLLVEYLSVRRDKVRRHFHRSPADRSCPLRSSENAQIKRFPQTTNCQRTPNRLKDSWQCHSQWIIFVTASWFNIYVIRIRLLLFSICISLQFCFLDNLLRVIYCRD